MQRPNRPRPLFIVSDGTGDTAEKVVRAGLLQFSGYFVHLQVFPNVTEPEQLNKLMGQAARADALMVTTLVRPAMRLAAQELAAEHGLTEHLARLFRWTPEINMALWKAADETITRPLADAIMAKAGRPSFKITIKE
jgi:hypothetical protein